MIGGGNITEITHFILLGFSDFPRIIVVLFVVFLVIYILTLTWNLSLLILIRMDSHLHTPMYFFLSSLSFMDICYVTSTAPKMLYDFFQDRQIITYALSLGPKQKAKSKTQGSKDLSSTPGLAVSSCESVGKALTSQSLTHFVCNMKPSPSPPQLSVTTSLQMSPHHFQGNHSFCPGFPLHDEFYVFHFSIIVLK